MSTQNRHVAPDSASAAPVLALRVLAVASVAVITWQFVTAAGLFTGGAVGPHAAGSIVLHIVTGLTAGAAIWLRTRNGGPWWPSVVATVVFVLTFVQGYFGTIPGLIVHLPGAMALTAGSVWLAAWSFLRLR
ncbi:MULTISPECIES: hypothetical protein [Pseudonocardia]|uniref:Integral membrane protein n=2 Tax=Pseudonocardia TaxID=1847 RepID=A0A1Y2N7S2_PSEAH|nr:MULTISPECIES: hypothetical protein [Pseudonocardia]OSY43239.1 hypothetical protein BG845_00844 [Pseudonocardia autotrophica]TDN71727.1 hypothetical protein C8E95_0761 [Pseudonocardia autotrophica]BBG02414.1 hypothetical protein Pdca_36230 [Pseudonocardia autotrophica]GEC23250.1 hypothetical protein PSA01_02790 [Pseudonocardia saturnea]